MQTIPKTPRNLGLAMGILPIRGYRRFPANRKLSPSLDTARLPGKLRDSRPAFARWRFAGAAAS